jgi:transcriptional regulator with XRE-family HTH domain
MTGHAGTLLHSARTARGMAQWQVTRYTGISTSRLSVLERGKGLMRPGEATALAAVLGIAPADLTRAPAPPPLPWHAALVKSFTEIPRTCPCDWDMRFAGFRPSGWRLAQARPGCRHHGAGAR